jgi:hypothetical protein
MATSRIGPSDRGARNTYLPCFEEVGCTTLFSLSRASNRALCFPSQRPLFGREQGSFPGKDHPCKTPPIRNNFSVGVVTKVPFSIANSQALCTVKWSSQLWSTSDKLSSSKSSRVKSQIALQTVLNSVGAPELASFELSCIASDSN